MTHVDVIQITLMDLDLDQDQDRISVNRALDYETKRQTTKCLLATQTIVQVPI